MRRRAVLALPWVVPVAAQAQAPARGPAVAAPAAAPTPESLGLSGPRLAQATAVASTSAHWRASGRLPVSSRAARQQTAASATPPVNPADTHWPSSSAASAPRAKATTT